MKIYDYSKIGRCFLGNNLNPTLEEIIGVINIGLLKPMVREVHPKEKERQERLAKRRESSANYGPGLNMLRSAATFSKKCEEKQQENYTYNDSVIIFSGNYGFGIKDISYFDTLFSELNEVLERNNTHILFVRGNGDNPSYFSEEKINYSNIKTIQDYSIIKLNGFNCLCIGGGVSSDRAWKKTNEETLGKKIYWENEACIDKLDELENTLKDIKISCVITYDVPTFVSPTIGDYKFNKWFKSDKELIKDSIASRLIMDGVYHKLLINDTLPYVWWYAGTSQRHSSSVSGIFFLSSPGVISSLNDKVYREFGVALSKTDNDKVSKMKSIFSKIKTVTTAVNDTVDMFDEPFAYPVEPAFDMDRVGGGRVLVGEQMANAIFDRGPRIIDNDRG